MFKPSVAVLAVLLAATPVLAEPAAPSPDALVVTAGAIATSTAALRPADRVAIQLEAANAWRRHKDPVREALSLEAGAGLALAAQAGWLPGEREVALAKLAAGFRAAKQPARADALVAGLPADLAGAARLPVAEALAEGGLAPETDKLLGADADAVARATRALGWRRAGDAKKAVALGAEALTAWKALSADAQAETAIGLAPLLWRAGDQKEALAVAQKLPKSAWPLKVRPFVLAIADHPVTASQKPALAAWLQTALANLDAKSYWDLPSEAELLAAIAMAFQSADIDDRPYFSLLAADGRMEKIFDQAGDDADDPKLTALRASALVRIGDGYVRIARGKDATDRFARGERLASTLDGPQGGIEPAEIRSRAAMARARAGVPEEAVKSALAIPIARWRALALLAVDELAPGAPQFLTAETAEALATAARP